MSITMTILLIAMTVVVSIAGFGNTRVVESTIFSPPAVLRRREWHRLVTYGFVHADGTHLLFNMFRLWSFGSVVEPIFSAWITPLGFVGFYLSALVASILPTFITQRNNPNYRSLGASGGVSAVLFSAILFDPWSKLIIFPIPVPIPAVLFAVLYVAYSVWMDRRGSDNVNHSAHLWGAAYGVVFTLVLRPRVLDHFLGQLQG